MEAETAAASAQGALDAALEEITALQLAKARDAAVLEAATTQVSQLDAALAALKRDGEQALADKMQVVGMLEQQIESLQAHNAGLVGKVGVCMGRGGDGDWAYCAEHLETSGSMASPDVLDTHKAAIPWERNKT